MSGQYRLEHWDGLGWVQLAYLDTPSRYSLADIISDGRMMFPDQPWRVTDTDGTVLRLYGIHGSECAAVTFEDMRLCQCGACSHHRRVIQLATTMTGQKS